MYRPGKLSVTTLPSSRPTLQCSAAQPASLAVIEFDEMGELWRPENPPAGSTVDPGRDQLNRALDAIRAAVSASPHAIVLVFTHGWKNNAAEDNGNAAGLARVVQYLAQTYCEPAVGVFLAWRGNLISEYMPVAQTFSYFNREKAAIRIPGSAFTDVLNQIVVTAHTLPPGASGEVRPKVILVGHSFGGLIMERALSQATLSKIPLGDSSPGTALDVGCGRTAQIQTSLPDLTLFVNSAAAATEAKQMLDFLKAEHIHYTNCDSKAPRPLFISISSSSDAATRFAMPVGHGPSFLRFKLMGSLRNSDPPVMWDPKYGSTPSQGAFYMSTAAHMQILQSHLVLPAEEVPAGTSPADRVAEFALSDTKQKFVIINKQNRWNDTPYWLMEVPSTIIPDHSTIFTLRFIDLLKEFLPSEKAPSVMTK
jgi:hypothetical protein